MSARRAKKARAPAMEVLEKSDASLLEIVDNVLGKGVVLEGEVMLGVAGVDLIYLRLSALLCMADRVFPRARARRR